MLQPHKHSTLGAISRDCTIMFVGLLVGSAVVKIGIGLTTKT
jgi:hypothetical protein